MFRKFIPILLLGLTYILGQSYQFFNNRHYDSYGSVNWILDHKHPMLISWNVKLLTEEINRLIEAIAFFMMLKGVRDLYRLAALEYLLYRCLDIIFYIYNFKTERYWYVFLIFGTIMAVIYLKRNAKATNEKTTHSW